MITLEKAMKTQDEIEQALKILMPELPPGFEDRLSDEAAIGLAMRKGIWMALGWVLNDDQNKDAVNAFDNLVRIFKTFQAFTQALRSGVYDEPTHEPTHEPTKRKD